MNHVSRVAGHAVQLVPIGVFRLSTLVRNMFARSSICRSSKPIWLHLSVQPRAASNNS